MLPSCPWVRVPIGIAPPQCLGNRSKAVPFLWPDQLWLALLLPLLVVVYLVLLRRRRKLSLRLADIAQARQAASGAIRWRRHLPPLLLLLLGLAALIVAAARPMAVINLPTDVGASANVLSFCRFQNAEGFAAALA